ncbi:MAG: CoA transferase [Chloroflexi bacterium]|nr:CoA transferase [Chloroflexota bacterium]
MRVLDVTENLAGPYCAMVLADLGAEVIKVERAGEGDHVRHLGPPFVNGESAAFLALHRNKQSITLNLKHPRGRDLFLELVRHADVVVENFRPGALDRLGIGYEAAREVNRKIVYGSISGFGQTGPYRERGGYDTIAQAMSGIMSATGHPDSPPAKCGVPIGDIGTGIFTALGLVSAYVYAQRTGRGQRLDASLLECAIAFSIWENSWVLSGGDVPGPLGSVHRRNAPHQAFRTADGFVAICADQPHFFQRLCALIGRPELLDDSRYRDNAARVANKEALAADIESVIGTQPTQYWVDELVKAEIPGGPVYRYDQVFDDPQVAHREMAVEVDHPVAGRGRVTGSPLKFSETPARVRSAAPTLGQHNHDVFRDLLGYSESELARWRDAGVI